MNGIAAFAVRLCAMSLLLSVLENLVPEGRLKRAALIGFGLVLISFVIGEITGIIERMGV